MGVCWQPRACFPNLCHAAAALRPGAPAGHDWRGQLCGVTDTCTYRSAPSPACQVITASHDKTVRLWDLRMGKTLATLTHHKKVRAWRRRVARGRERPAADSPRRHRARAHSRAAPPAWLLRLRRPPAPLTPLLAATVPPAGGARAGGLAHGAHLLLGCRRQHEEVQAAPRGLSAQLPAAAAGGWGGGPFLWRARAGLRARASQFLQSTSTARPSLQSPARPPRL